MLTALPPLLLALLPFSSASPAPIKPAAGPEQPLISPSPASWEATKTYKSRRGIIRDLAGDVSSILAGLGSDIPSYVASGVPDFFRVFPNGDAVVSSLGLNDGQIAVLPTQVMNIP